MTTPIRSASKVTLHLPDAISSGTIGLAAASAVFGYTTP